MLVPAMKPASMVRLVCARPRVMHSLIPVSGSALLSRSVVPANLVVKDRPMGGMNVTL